MIFNFLKKNNDAEPILSAIILIPKKNSIIIKLAKFRKDDKNKEFFEFGKIKYFINYNKITLLENKLTLFYKFGISEPIEVQGTTEEMIFSKELTDALKSKVIKEFRTVENIEVIEEIDKKLTILMLVCGVLSIILLLVYLKVKSIDEIVNIDLKEIKDLLNTIRIIP